MPRPSFRLSASRILPLPGIGELEGAINGLRDTLNASGYAKEEYESLVNHLESLLVIARSASQPEDFTELFHDLTDIKSRLEAEFNRKSRISMMRSQARLELLDNMNREVDRMLMRFQLRSLAQSNKLPAVQKRASGIENMLVIPSHEILPQEETWSRFGQHSSSRGLLRDAYNTDDGRVMISQRLGRYNKLSVIYKTYSSMSDDAAAEWAAMELKFLSKCLHKNVAKIVGVTKGYHGLDGVIMQIGTKGELPPEEFLSRPMSGAALVHYIRGVHSALSFMNSRPEGPQPAR
ncbi:hypothetical protein BDV93DRAFT_42915 [Ceratobasidium sp. AG-I]|nr:hypothetical protein BDV93DRAFT_42915 [Ceratobasidium sp. AG-I]